MYKFFCKIQSLIDEKILLTVMPGWIYDFITVLWWKLYDIFLWIKNFNLKGTTK